MYGVHECFRHLLVCWHFPHLSCDRFVYHQTRDLSGQSTPHMIRSRATHHVIQSATLATFQVRSKCMQIPLSCNADLMVFTTKHVMYQVKVCFRDLLVCCYFPPLTWVGQGTPVMWFRFSRYHCLVTLVLWCLQLNTWFIRSKSVFMTYLYAAIFQPSRE